MEQALPYFDPNYETLSSQIDPLGVVVDNSTCENATLITVTGVNTHGVLLEVVQVLTDLNLCISKAYISSDGGWFLDVFYVTDQNNEKVMDDSVIEDIKLSLRSHHDLQRRAERRTTTSGSRKIVADHMHTAIELTGADRRGLFSEISAVLTAFGCNIKHANVWTHNLRVACVVYVTDEETGAALDPVVQAQIRKKLTTVMNAGMNGGNDQRGSKVEFGNLLTNPERRLHQMMFEDRDFQEEYEAEGPRAFPGKETRLDNGRPFITIENCKQNGYSIVNVECVDRPKLLFDTVCTLKDMQYVVFHATINSEEGYAHQEYYIRHVNGRWLESEDERATVKKCLVAAIERQVADGLRLQLCTSDRVGLLSKVSRILREYGLSVTRADVFTMDKQAVDVFYLTNAGGKPPDRRIVDAMLTQMWKTIRTVTEVPWLPRSLLNEPAKLSKGLSSGSLAKSQLAVGEVDLQSRKAGVAKVHGHRTQWWLC